MGNGRYVDIARPTGADGIKDGRGVAIADLDNDGRLDLVISNNNAAPTLYLNQLESPGHWVRLKLEGSESNRNALGAKAILTAGGKPIHRVVEAGSGFASQAPLDLHFGLGAATRIDALEIHWPSGKVETFQGSELMDTPIDCTHRIREGAHRLIPQGTVAVDPVHTGNEGQ